MARPNYGWDKRQRERKKQQKKEEKRQRRARKTQDAGRDQDAQRDEAALSPADEDNTGDVRKIEQENSDEQREDR